MLEDVMSSLYLNRFILIIHLWQDLLCAPDCFDYLLPTLPRVIISTFNEHDRYPISKSLIALYCLFQT